MLPRGGQGQGKISANKMKEELESAGLRVGIFSTDSIFMNAKGEYEFVPFAIGAAHASPTRDDSIYEDARIRCVYSRQYESSAMGIPMAGKGSYA